MVTLTEEFDNVFTLPSKGWNQQNLSSPLGGNGWLQGDSSIFNSQSGLADSYISANFNNTGDSQRHQLVIG
jgi:hypothetical protein